MVEMHSRFPQLHFHNTYGASVGHVMFKHEQSGGTLIFPFQFTTDSMKRIHVPLSRSTTPHANRKIPHHPSDILA